MRIGIYGDSYAAPTPHNDLPFDESLWDTRSWTYLLKRHHEVKNFAKSGTCIWYSFERFQNTFQEFDAIVFAWTDYTRVAVDAPFEGYSATLSHPAALAGFLRATPIREHEFQKQVRKFLTTTNEVFPWLFSRTQQQYLAEKCFLDVQRLCKLHDKRLINICTFEDHDSIPNVFPRQERTGPMLTGLQKVADRETLIKSLGNHPFFDGRSNHLFPVNNIVLHDLITERLQDNSLNDIYNCNISGRFQYREEDWDAHFQA